MHFPVGSVSGSALVLVIFNDVVENRTAVHVTVLGYGVAVGAPELLRGRTGARNIALLGLSNFAERDVCRG